MSEQIKFSTRNILERTQNFSPQVGIILGTGLGGLANEIEKQFIIPYSDIPHFAHSTVEGHSGNLIFGILGGKKVMAMQGRLHFYEGFTMQQITFPVRVMRQMGVTSLVVSNAAGGMNPGFAVGDLMLITDHINLFPTNPLIGKNDDALGPRFPDMSEAYCKEYITLAKKIAQEKKIKIQEGVYAGLTGPCFETPAEYRYLWRMGADAVGMSTVPEVIAARHGGMKVFGVSIITDLGVEGAVEKITHEEVIRAANAQEKKLSNLVMEMVKRL